MTSYWVEQRADVAIDGQPFRVAWGRRIDNLNLADSALYKAEQEDWAIVSLAHMDEELVQDFLAPLAHQKAMGPEEYTAADQGARVNLARRATAVVTKELTTTTCVTAADAQQLQSAIASRNDALVGLANGYEVSATSRIWLSPGTVRALTRTKARGGYEGKLAGEILQMNDRMKLHAKPVLPAIAELAQIEEEQFLGRLAEEKRLREERRAADEALSAAEDARRARLHSVIAKPLLRRPTLAPSTAMTKQTATSPSSPMAPSWSPTTTTRLTSPSSPASRESERPGRGWCRRRRGGSGSGRPEAALLRGIDPRDRAIAAGELATLARDQSSPRLALWLLVRRATAMSASPRSESGATALVLGELFGQLGLGSWKKLRVDDAFLASAAAALEKPPEENPRRRRPRVSRHLRPSGAGAHAHRASLIRRWSPARRLFS